MRYCKINDAIWEDERFSSLGIYAKMLFVYLLSCSKGNSIGIFKIGLGQIEDEMKEDRDLLTEAMDQLEGFGLINREGNWTWFNKYLKWNEPTSPNHARKLAAELSEVIMRGAPKKAVINFLMGTKLVLSGMMMQQQKEGRKRSYFDEFKSALEVDFVGNYIGGVEVLKKCLDGTYEVLQKDLPSTDADLQKPTIGSAPNNISSASNNNGSPSNKIGTNTIQDNTKQYNTRQDNRSCPCNREEPSEYLLPCSDGAPHALGQASVRLALERLGEGFHERLCIMQRDILSGRFAPPSPDEIDDWFISSLGGAT